MHRRTFLGLSATTAFGGSGVIAVRKSQTGSNDRDDQYAAVEIPDEVDVGWNPTTPDDPDVSLSIKIDHRPPQATIDLYPDVDGYDSVYRPKPGEMFLIIVFELTHTGDTISDATNLLLLENDGIQIEPETFEDQDNPSREQLEPALAGKRLTTGELTGWLAYSVPRTVDMARVTINETVGPGEIAAEFRGQKITGIEEAFAPPPANAE